MNSATTLCGRLHKEAYRTSISIMQRQNVGEFSAAPTCVYLPLHISFSPPSSIYYNGRQRSATCQSVSGWWEKEEQGKYSHPVHWCRRACRKPDENVCVCALSCVCVKREKTCVTPLLFERCCFQLLPSHKAKRRKKKRKERKEAIGRSPSGKVKTRSSVLMDCLDEDGRL